MGSIASGVLPAAGSAGSADSADSAGSTGAARAAAATAEATVEYRVAVVASVGLAKRVIGPAVM